jgi:predicted MFS family arabinose efflux permease
VTTSSDVTSPDPLALGSGDVRRFYGWRIVGVLAVTETVSWGILYYAFSVFLEPMRRDLGMSTAAVSGAFSLALVVMGLTALPVGRWLDRHGARTLMAGGSVLASVVVAAWSQVQEAWQLYAVFALLGAAGAMVLYEPAFAVVVRWFDRRRARALLVVTVVAGFASTIFVPTAAALENSLGWRDALLVLAGLLAVTTVLPHALVLRRDPADLGVGPDGDGPPRPRSSPSVRTSLRRTGREVWGEPRFRWLTVAFALHTLAVIGVSVHLFPFLREQGHGLGLAAGVTGALGALSVTGRLVVTGLFSRMATLQVTAGVFALQAAAAVVLLAAPASTAAAVVFVLLFGLGFGVGTIARPALVVETYGVARYATVSALMGLALTAAKVTGPVAVGVSRTAAGSYDPALLALVVVCVASAVTLRAAHRATDAGAGG